MKLYMLMQRYQNLIDLIEDESIPIEDIMPAVKELEEDIIFKAAEMAKLLKNIDADITAYKTEENRLKAKRQSLERKYEGIKQYLETELKQTGIKKVDGIVKLSFRKSPPSVGIVDVKQIPPEYLVTKEPEPDKKTILEKLKAGEEIPGTELITNREYLKID